MSKALLFLTEGFEETEAIVTADILRRGNVELTLVSLTDKLTVLGSHNISICTDIVFREMSQKQNYDILILPGGPGTTNYKNNEEFLALVKFYAENDKYLAAICAAPTVLSGMGLLKGIKATCYKGMESELLEACYTGNSIEVDGKFITGDGPGSSMAFGFKLLEILEGKEISSMVQGQFRV